MDFVLNFAMCSADFTCFNGLPFWILNKNFQETAFLSIVLSLFIHKINSKHVRDYNIQAKFKLKSYSPSLHASLFAKMSANEFYSKILFTVYSILLI